MINVKEKLTTQYGNGYYGGNAYMFILINYNDAVYSFDKFCNKIQNWLILNDIVEDKSTIGLNGFDAGLIDVLLDELIEDLRVKNFKDAMLCFNIVLHTIMKEDVIAEHLSNTLEKIKEKNKI